MALADFQGIRGERTESLTGDRSMDAHRLRQLVIKDDLTELYNRRYFKERLREEKKRGDLQGLPFSLLILDVDCFKEVNDNFGHLAGDKVLIQLARIIGESVREIDISCRYAGDEFVVILPGAAEKETEVVVRRIVTNLNAFRWAERAGIDLPKLTCSVGFCCYPEDARELSQLIKRADRALILAKKQGKDRWLRWSASCPDGLDDPGTAPPNQTLEIVGRIRERERMMRAIEQVRNGTGCTVVVGGELGVGKTRLIQYAIMRAEHSGFQPLLIYCFKETAEIPYFPLRDIMSYLEGAFKENLYSSLSEIGLEHSQELSRFYPSVAGKGRSAIASTDRMPGPTEDYLLFEAFLRLFSRLSRIMPMMIVVENVQWADSATRKLLDYLIRAIARERIFLALLVRTGGETSSMPIGNGDWNGRRDAPIRIQLGNLSREESHLLIEELMKKTDLPLDLLDAIYQRSAGNPLFVEEMVRYLKREGRIPTDPATGQKDLSVSGSIMEILKGQADSIPEDRRGVLSMASVIGTEFSFDLLMLLSLKNEGYLLDVIDEAVKQGVLQTIPHPSEDRYAFVNPLFRQVLYEGINKRRRRNLHREIGRFIEKYYFDRIEDLYGDLAFHFQRSGNILKAVEYTIKAGDRAARLFANQDAIRFFDQALAMMEPAEGEILTERGLRLQLLEKKGEILDLIGEYDQAESVYGELLRCLVSEEWSKESQARIVGKLGVILDKKGDTAAAIRKLQSGLELTIRGDGECRARLLGSLADIYLREGKMDAAIDCCTEGLRCLSHGKRSVVGAQIYMTFGGAYLEKGDVKRGKYYMRRGIDIFDSIGEIKGLGRAYLSMGTLYYARGNYEKAREYYRKSMDLASKTGNVTVLMSSYNNLGMVERVHGNFRSAVKNWEEGLAIAEKIDHRRYIAFLKNNLGNAMRELGDYSIGLSHLTDSLALFRDLGSASDVRRVNRGLAILHLRLGNLEHAEKAIIANDPPLDEKVESGDRLMDIDVYGRVCKEKGHYEEAEALLVRAVEGYRRGNDPEDLAVGLLHAVELYIEWGKTDKAIPLLEEGEKLSRKIQSRKGLAVAGYLRGCALLGRDRNPAQAAVPILKKALREFTSIKLPYFRMLTHRALGRAYEKMGRPEESSREYRASLEIVQSLKKRILDRDLLQAFERHPLVAEISSKASGRAS